MSEILTHLPNGLFNALPLAFWTFLLCMFVFFSVAVVHFYHKAYADHNYVPPWVHWLEFFVRVIKTPMIMLFASIALYSVWNLYQFTIPSEQSYDYKKTAPYLLHLVEYLIFFWIVFNFLTMGKKYLIKWSRQTTHKTLAIILPAISSSLQAAIGLLMVNILIPQLNFDGDVAIFLEKFAKVMFIMVLGWVFYQSVNVLEKYILNQYSENQVNFLTARKINTQVLILKRVILSIVFIIVLGSCLMVFDSVKNIGTGLITTAGIISAVGAFASQQSLSRLFAGLQIAFTQPIRIGDTVIIEKELGQIEEITLSYIVVKLWDLRKLIMPTDYFTSKGIQNLTRDSTQLLGTIFIYADYSLPIEAVRNKFNEFLQQSAFWDKKSSALQVTDLKENTMELRALMSAENSSTLWNLRCEMREKLIQFIVEHYPECLSRTRTVMLKQQEEG